MKIVIGQFGSTNSDYFYSLPVAEQSTRWRPVAALVKRCGGYLARYSTVAITALCLMITGAAASQEFMAAGVLLVADEQQPALILLVKHHSRSIYEMPGGRRQLVGRAGAERHETAHETAVREVYEETRGYLSPDYLREAIDPSRSVQDGGFVFFIARIDRFPTTAMAEISHLDDDSSARFREVADYAWVKIESVFASSDATAIDEDGRRIELRRQLKSRLERARAAGWL